MNFEEAKVQAQILADKLQEATSVIPYGGSFVVETQASTHANGLRRVFDAFPQSMNDPRTPAVGRLGMVLGRIERTNLKGVTTMKRAIILTLGLALLTGCAVQARRPELKSTEALQIEACQEKNGDPDASVKSVAEMCEAITKKGVRCSRRVPEAGLLCKQHSKMQKAGKEVKTVK